MLRTSLCEIDTSISLSETSFAGLCNDLIRSLHAHTLACRLVGGCEAHAPKAPSPPTTPPAAAPALTPLILWRRNLGNVSSCFHSASNQLFHKLFYLINFAPVRLSSKVGFHSNQFRNHGNQMG